MIGRRAFITLLSSAAAAWPLTARAQQATKHYRIGMLFPTSPTANAANLNAFRQRLQELGYVEGRNLVIDYRSAEGRPDRFPVLAAELVNLKADLIMTRGTPAALAAKSATRTIPVVMAAIGEAVETGVVASIAQPGGNITGLSSFIADVVSKRLELLSEMVQNVRRIGRLPNRITPSAGWNGTTSKKQPGRCVSKPISSTCVVQRISAGRSNWRYRNGQTR